MTREEEQETGCGEEQVNGPEAPAPDGRRVLKKSAQSGDNGQIDTQATPLLSGVGWPGFGSCDSSA